MDRHRFISLRDSKEGLLEKLRFLESSQLAEYRQEALSLFQDKKIRNWSEAHLVEFLYYTTLREKHEKEENIDYYRANLQGFWNTIHWALNDNFLSNQLTNYQPSCGKDLLITNWYFLLFSLLKDAVWLLEIFEHKKKITSEYEYTFDKKPIHHFDLYKEMSRILFAQSPFPRHTTYYIGLLRQMIELRIRHAVGILGRIDSASSLFKPVSMELIFDVLNKCSRDKKIEFAVPIKNIQRIYAWSNIHIHSGLEDFTWKYLIAYKYIGPLMLGKKVGDSDSPDFGIQTDPESLAEIQKTVRECLEAKQNRSRRNETERSQYELWTLKEPAVLLRPRKSDTA
jgi:hypothetical protein